MARITMQGKGNSREIVQYLGDEMLKTGMSVELLESFERMFHGVTVYTLVFEKYFMRSSNRASLTAVIMDQEGEILVDIIGSAGGQGVFFKMSWGAEEDFIYSLESILETLGFSRIEQ